MTLSVCMIVKNEEHCLTRALESVKDLADQIIIIDTGSTDHTKDIAARYTDNIYDFAWCDDFSKARNFSLSKATGSWILVLDADEVLAQEDHDAIRQLCQNNSFAGYAFHQISYTNDITQYNYIPLLDHDSLYQKYKKYSQYFSGYISCSIIRLFRNNLGIHFDGAVHESVDASCREKGKMLKTDLWLHHYQFERGADVIKEKQLHYLKIYEQHLDEYPEKARAYRDIGSIYYTYTTNYEKASHYFRQSLALNDRNKKTYIGLGLCYLKQHKFHDALRVFEMGLHIFPGDAHLLSLKNIARAT